MAQTHICGKCGKKFTTEERYLDHICIATDFTPRDPEHLGEDFKKVSEAALKRGQEKATA